MTHLGYVDVSPSDVGQLRSRLNQDLGEVVIEVAGGNHVETHQDVEGQREHWQVPATVYRRQGAGHDRAETQPDSSTTLKLAQHLKAQ